MKRLTHLMTYLVIISSLALLWSCSNDDNTGPTDFVRGRGQCETIIKTIMLR